MYWLDRKIETLQKVLPCELPLEYAIEEIVSALLNIYCSQELYGGKGSVSQLR
jgi:hypothetical protein